MTISDIHHMESDTVTQVLVPDEQIEALEELCPLHLQGGRAATRRVIWALDEFIKSRGVSTDEPQGGKRGK